MLKYSYYKDSINGMFWKTMDIGHLFPMSRELCKYHFMLNKLDMSDDDNLAVHENTYVGHTTILVGPKSVRGF